MTAGNAPPAEPASNTTEIPSGPPVAANEVAGHDSGDDDAQHTLWSGSYSWRALIPVWLAAIGLALVVGAICAPKVGLWNASFVFLVTAVVGLGGVGLYLAYRRLSAVYTLTPDAFVHQSGLLARTTMQVELVQIDDVAFDQGRIERWVGTGTIKLISGDKSTPDILLDSIAPVNAVAARIDTARREARKRRGWFIETD